MWNKKPKNIIDWEEAIELFKGFGFDAKRFNYYQIRIYPEETHKFYDWYHTRGTLTVISNGKTERIGSVKTAERVVELIRENLLK